MNRAFALLLCFFSLSFAACDYPSPLMDGSMVLPVDGGSADGGTDAGTDSGTDGAANGGVDGGRMPQPARVDVRMHDFPYSGFTSVRIMVGIAGRGCLSWESADPMVPSCSRDSGTAIEAAYESFEATAPLGEGRWGLLVPMGAARYSWEASGCAVPAGTDGEISARVEAADSIIVAIEVEANTSTCADFCVGGGHGAFCRESCEARGVIRGMTSLRPSELMEFNATGTFSTIVRFE